MCMGEMKGKKELLRSHFCLEIKAAQSLKPDFPDGAEERFSCSCVCYVSSNLICRLAIIMSPIAVF